MRRGSHVLVAVGSGILAVVWLIAFVVILFSTRGPGPWSLASLVAFLLLAVVSIVFIRKALVPPRRADSRSHPIAIGVLTGWEREGMYVNDVRVVRLHLDVRTSDGRSFPGVLCEPVPESELARLGPGTTIPVVYDPNEPAELARPSPDRRDEVDRVWARHRM